MPEALPRRLAAILSADIAGYSALMGSNEEQTVSDLKAHQAALLPKLLDFGGRLIDTAGDGIFADFASVVNALNCAVAIQKMMVERNASLPPARSMHFRIGLHIGDVIFDAERIYGDGVNIAARLEGMAEPGSIYISRQVYDQVEAKSPLAFKPLGPHWLKNIAKPVEVFAVEDLQKSTASAGEEAQSSNDADAVASTHLEERRLVAVMAAGVADYSALVESDREYTQARMSRLEVAVVNPSIATHRGRIAKATNDGFVATFNSALEAAGCAIALQQGFGRLGEHPGAPPIRLRLGLDIADVTDDTRNIFGEEQSHAAGLLAVAEPGGIVVSASEAEQLRGRPGIELVDLGECKPSSLQRAIHAFAIRARGVAPTMSPPEVPSVGSDRPSIAVLPLRQSHPDPEQAYFADGVTEGIIHVLSGLPELFVISHGSMAAFAAGETDVCDVGRSLGVRYAVDGILRRTNNRLRITTRLFDVEDGSLLRTGRFEGMLDDLFEIQDRVSADVVATIAPSVQNRELVRALRKAPGRMTAYDYVLRALDLMPRLEHGCFETAGELLQKAVDADRAYSPAWSYLALWHLIRLAQGWASSVPDDITAAGRAADAALARDPRNSTALAIRAHYLSYTQRDFIGATALLEQAVTNGPNNPMAWALSSATSGYRGDGARAILEAQHALRLSPIDPFAYLSEYLLGQAHYIAGDFPEACRIGRRVAALNGMHAANLRLLTVSLVATQDIAAAQGVAKRLLAINPTFRLSAFAAQTPLTGPVLEEFCNRLRTAGLPD